MLKNNLLIAATVILLVLLAACSPQPPTPPPASPSPVPPAPSSPPDTAPTEPELPPAYQTTPPPDPEAPPAPTPTPEPVPETASRDIIQDNKGKLWDITHAREIYDMEPRYFNYGLGVGVIASVDEPTVLEEGDDGYPDPDSRVRVFGVDRNGEQRGYNVTDLSYHEVFNDVFPGDTDQYVAVTF